MSGIRARQARINVAYDEQEKEITITINGPTYDRETISNRHG